MPQLAFAAFNFCAFEAVSRLRCCGARMRALLCARIRHCALFALRQSRMWRSFAGALQAGSAKRTYKLCSLVQIAQSAVNSLPCFGGLRELAPVV
jgi:hypothetical protein